MKIFKNKKTLTIILAIACVLALALGSLAYFTDRVTGGAFFKTADASKIINVTPNEDGSESDDPGADLEEVWKNQNVVDPQNPNKPAPMAAGSVYDLSYDLTNLGEKVDIRETFYLTVVDSADEAIALDADDPAWRLFSAYTTDTFGAKDGTTAVSVEKISVNQIKYEIAPYVLDAEGVKANAYHLILDKYADNTYQASTCKVEYLIEARQHVEGEGNNYADWQTICTSQIDIFGGISNYPAVPAR